VPRLHERAPIASLLAASSLGPSKSLRAARVGTCGAPKSHLGAAARAAGATEWANWVEVFERADRNTRSLNSVPARDTSRILMYIVDASSFSRITAAL
jgi:hypothetical protein